MCDVKGCNTPADYIVKLKFNKKHEIQFKICNNLLSELKNCDCYELTPIKLVPNTMRNKIR